MELDGICNGFNCLEQALEIFHKEHGIEPQSEADAEIISSINNICITEKVLLRFRKKEEVTLECVRQLDSDNLKVVFNNESKSVGYNTRKATFISLILPFADHWSVTHI